MLKQRLIEPEQLADSKWRAANLDEQPWKIIELSPLEIFNQAHIANSVHLDYRRTQPGMMPEPGGMLDKSVFSDLLSELGVTPETTLILSDYEGGGWAGRFAWMLDVAGHQSYAYLNGGLRAWLGAGFAVETEQPEVTPSHYPIQQYQNSYSIDKNALLEKLGQPDFAIWDARSYAEFTGEKAFSAFGGHIPGAVHYEWTQLMDESQHLRLKPLEELKTHLNQLGLSADKTIATHCQTHHRSGLTYLVGKLLGFNMLAYAGSWAQWGNDPDTPKELGES